MKTVIASDIHGSLPALSAVFAAVKRENADLLVLLGDLYYHGPRNPLPEGYAPMKVAEALNAYPANSSPSAGIATRRWIRPYPRFRSARISRLLPKERPSF